MSSLRKRKWVWFLVLLIVIGGGIFFTLHYTSIFSGYSVINSNCKFNPAISDKNKALIEETILTVAHEGVFSLMGKEKHLRTIGKIVSSEVSDFAYWAYVLSTPQLIQGMKIIQKSSLKYKGYIRGTRDKIMKEYHENPCLLEQAKEFAKYLKLPENQTIAVLQECIANSENKNAFKKYIDYLIKTKSK